jgi:hypothetical protein
VTRDCLNQAMDGYCRNAILERIMFYERQFGEHRNAFFPVGHPAGTRR